MKRKLDKPTRMLLAWELKLEAEELIRLADEQAKNDNYKMSSKLSEIASKIIRTAKDIIE